MAFSFDKILGFQENALKLRAERANVLASNLANADTPNFKAKDFDFNQALKAQMGVENGNLAMRTNSTGHMSNTHFSTVAGGYQYRTPNQPSIDGNTVEEQVEHAEFMKNTLEFQTAFTLLNSKFKGLTKAIKGE